MEEVVKYVDEDEIVGLLNEVAEISEQIEAGKTLKVYDTYDWQHESEKFKPEVMAAAILRAGGRQAQAAKLLGLHRHAIARAVKKYEICALARQAGLAHTVEEIESALIHNATEKMNVIAQIFSLKNLGRGPGNMTDDGWRDAQRNEHLHVHVEKQTLKIGEKEIEF